MKFVEFYRKGLVVYGEDYKSRLLNEGESVTAHAPKANEMPNSIDRTGVTRYD